MVSLLPFLLKVHILTSQADREGLECMLLLRGKADHDNKAQLQHISESKTPASRGLCSAWLHILCNHVDGCGVYCVSRTEDWMISMLTNILALKLSLQQQRLYR